MTRRLLIAFALIAAMALVIAGCAGSTGGTGTPSSSTPATGIYAVNIANFSFSPPSLTVKTGTSVTWTNNDSTQHTITSDANGSQSEGAIFNSKPLATGEAFSFTFTQSGTFPYHCSIHTNMKGTIVVQN